MAFSGKGVVLASGKRGILASGKGALFDGAAECATCCEEATPCTDCYDPVGSSAEVTGDVTVTMYFEMMDSWGTCTEGGDCEWAYFNNGEPYGPHGSQLTVAFDALSETWCIEFWTWIDGTYRNAPDCPCDSYFMGTVTGISCHAGSGELQGSCVLPKVGGGGSVTVDFG